MISLSGSLLLPLTNARASSGSIRSALSSPNTVFLGCHGQRKEQKNVIWASVAPPQNLGWGGGFGAIKSNASLCRGFISPMPSWPWKKHNHRFRRTIPLSLKGEFKHIMGAKGRVDVLIECRNVYKSSGEKHILRGVSFKGVEDRLPSELSGGMNKRVALARSIIFDTTKEAIEPELLLYEEPTAVLDPIASTVIVEGLIRSVHTKGDEHEKPGKITSYVVVTHQHSTIRRAVDRLGPRLNNCVHRCFVPGYMIP